MDINYAHQVIKAASYRHQLLKEAGLGDVIRRMLGRDEPPPIEDSVYPGMGYGSLAGVGTGGALLTAQHRLMQNAGNFLGNSLEDIDNRKLDEAGNAAAHEARARMTGRLRKVVSSLVGKQTNPTIPAHVAKVLGIYGGAGLALGGLTGAAMHKHKYS